MHMCQKLYAYVSLINVAGYAVSAHPPQYLCTRITSSSCPAVCFQEDAAAAEVSAAIAHTTEVTRLQRAKAEYEASIPEDIKERVAEAVKLQMVRATFCVSVHCAPPIVGPATVAGVPCTPAALTISPLGLLRHWPHLEDESREPQGDLGL